MLPRFGKYLQRACTDFGDARGRRECCRRSAQVWTQPPQHMPLLQCSIASLNTSRQHSARELRADNYRDLIDMRRPPSADRRSAGIFRTSSSKRRRALSFVMNYEEARSPPCRTARLRGRLRSHSLAKRKPRPRPGHVRYGRVGFWRLMRLLQERKLPMTVFGCALALERHKPAADAIRATGFDVCCHGWR